MKEYKDNQQVFDIVSKHLLTQKVKCENKSGQGMYRYYKKRCAIGCLIPDDKYRKSFEGDVAFKFSDEPNEVGKLIQELYDVDSLLIIRLQGLHDQCDPLRWKEKLQWIAEDFKLEVNFQ